MPLVGTAGHVDHGKSTLIERLTGRDPDRWDEEKERGLTIDLGFAWTSLPSGTEASFVDVPGHGRFIKNMLAGIDGLDVALLVVAADEGWSVQTTEHAAALDALGISNAVVALTKVDLADDDMVQLAELEVEERLEGTSLAGSPIVPVSALTGDGIDLLVAALDQTLDGGTDRPGAADLWIDRVFNVAGAGTVVTGSLTQGSVTVGDELELLPAGVKVIVRGLQQHDAEVEAAKASSRVAINLSGLDRREISRGHRLRAPGTALATERLFAQVRPAPGGEAPGERGAYHLHLGSGSWSVELRPVEAGAAALVSTNPIPAAAGDRFVLRDVGRQQVVGGGTVLDPSPPARRRDLVGRASVLVSDGDPDKLAAGLLAARGSVESETLARLSGGGDAGERLGELRFADGHLADAATALPEIIDRYTTRWPLRPGHPKAELADAIGQAPAVVDALIERAGLAEIGPWVARPGYEPTPGEDDAAAMEDFENRLAKAGLAPERLDEQTVDPEHLGFLVRAGRVVRVGPFAYRTEALDDCVDRLPELGEEWTVADLRDHFGISRKHAVPLVEWLDAKHVTRRIGDVRSLRRSES